MVDEAFRVLVPGGSVAMTIWGNVQVARRLDAGAVPVGH
jgi:hypothetical protein